MMKLIHPHANSISPVIPLILANLTQIFDILSQNYHFSVILDNVVCGSLLVPIGSRYIGNKG